MKPWEIVAEEASIVLVGNFNPKIFHPEWLIRKEIVEEWDYSKDKVVNVGDLSQISLPSNRRLSVLLNQYALTSQMASDFLTLKDVVTNTFTVLKETPISQMGMNYTAEIKLDSYDRWRQFGDQLAPKQRWIDCIDYYDKLNEEQIRYFGLYELVMELPRNDDFNGYIRPKIKALSSADLTLTFNVNNHVEVEAADAMNMVKVLEQSWEGSLQFANELMHKIMNSELGIST